MSPYLQHQYQLYRAAIINYKNKTKQNLSSLKQQKFILSQFWNPEVQNQCVSGDTFPLDALWEQSPSLPLFSLWWLVVNIPWLCDLDTLKNQSPVFWRMSLRLDLSDVFSRSDLGYTSQAGMSQQQCCIPLFASYQVVYGFDWILFITSCQVVCSFTLTPY